ncbi:hypothetical protein [Blastopirellula retiformator]|uniref:Polymerase nucleotidyl transferase domain-containing protein n=1 Tax=Blastopirellula retiformator TaxID=2527970 RepID=A0A5C5V985_9BACT|nr:hypothetical protein [Blastopirellula retiformator]TWT34841.1 hypothetical protein Enr8_22560 [Blastopirellula retiformator]
MLRLRDKDYLLTNDGLIFNVLGYDHPDGAYVCGLKYVAGEKWLANYDEALRFLEQRYPHYVDQLIRVPSKSIAFVYFSDQRLPQLRESFQVGRLQKAVELADLFAEKLNLPPDAFSLTDSLLWSAGNSDSDIDLVIYGADNCEVWLQSPERIFALPEIEPITPEFIQRPPHLSDASFAQLCEQKWNQGYYLGTRFSVRGVRNWDEIPAPVPLVAAPPVERQLTIADRRQSLFFPVVYQTEQQIEVVSFHIGYEATFAPGDTIGVLGAQVDDRTILVGSRYGGDESITLVRPA